MTQFLPDAESITEYCGAYERRGCWFEVVPAPELGGYGLRLHQGEASTVIPIFPLPAAKMGNLEAAQQWMEHLRDNQVSQFFSVRKKWQPEFKTGS